jgi:PAS domain S-box-containing protein
MRLLQNTSLKHKLIMLIMLTCLIALLSSGAALVVWEWFEQRQSMVKYLSTQAEMIADNCKAALTFEDTEDAAEVLNSLHVESSIIFASVHNNTGQLFASYAREGAADKCLVHAGSSPVQHQRDDHHFEKGLLIIHRRVLLDNEEIGFVCLQSTLKPMYAALRHDIAVTAAVLLLVFVVVYFVSSRLQKVISGPILRLADGASKIGKGELNHRVEICSHDELGHLAKSFNEMAQKLKESYGGLEKKVQERTAELSTAKEKLQAIFGAAPVGLLLVDENAVVKQINSVVAWKVGKDSSLILNKPLGEGLGCIHCIHVAGTPSGCGANPFCSSCLLRSTLQNVFTSGEPVRGVEVQPTLTVNNDKSQPWFELNVEPVMIDGKRHAIIALEDITNRKHAEEKLKQAAEEWTTTFNSIPDMVSIHSKDYKLVRVNKAFADAFAMTPEELVGKTCYELIHAAAEPPMACPHKQTIDTKTPHIAEYFEPRLGIHLEVSSSPVLDDNDEIVGVVHVAKDITDRKHAEEKQAQLLRELESVNQELTDFAYIISHDLKAPLRAIGTLTDWIVSDYADKFDDEGKENVALLLNRVQRMQNLIDGVLQYSRVGRVKEDMVVVDLNELLSEIIDILAPPANISVTVENELPAIECEKTRITQVFQNLLSNAIKYLDKPQGVITVGCSEENGFWKFGVTDNGPGIEEKHFERIFKIFQTLQARDDVESTGIGLTVVKKIVELYGGKVWLESKVGEGTTFFFTLPKQAKEVKNERLETSVVGRG